MFFEIGSWRPCKMTTRYGWPSWFSSPSILLQTRPYWHSSSDEYSHIATCTVMLLFKSVFVLLFCAPPVQFSVFSWTPLRTLGYCTRFDRTWLSFFWDPWRTSLSKVLFKVRLHGCQGEYICGSQGFKSQIARVYQKLFLAYYGLKCFIYACTKFWKTSICCAVTAL